MGFERVVTRTLPEGISAQFFPFHISLEGLESNLLCRDEEDYDAVEKYIFVTALTYGIDVIIHVVMSNHAHVSVLATSLEVTRRMANELKRRCSMFLSRKYGERNVLLGTSVDVQMLDNNWYVRNTLAYIPRNIVEIGSRIEDYPWCGYRAMFTGGKSNAGYKAVASLTRREKEGIMHTHANLGKVPWMLDRDGHLVPATCSNWQYLEAAFDHDQAFFLKTIGSLNPEEMKQKLVTNLRIWRPDSEFLLTVNDLAGRWFQNAPAELTPEQKIRLVPYIYRCYRTSVPQLARCLRMPREEVKRLTQKPKMGRGGDGPMGGAMGGPMGEPRGEPMDGPMGGAGSGPMSEPTSRPTSRPMSGAMGGAGSGLTGAG